MEDLTGKVYEVFDTGEKYGAWPMPRVQFSIMGRDERTVLIKIENVSSGLKLYRLMLLEDFSKIIFFEVR